MGDTKYRDTVVIDETGNEKDLMANSNYSSALNMLGPQYAPHIEKVRQSAYRTADEAYKQSINSANSAYQRSLSSYGANAERLASSGLGMSGVSDYGNSAAYYALRNEVQNAGTQLTSAKQAADDVAYERQTAYNTQQSDRYMNVLAGVSDGTYSSDMVENLIKEYGFDNTRAEALRGAVDTKKTKDFNSILSDISNGQYTSNDIDSIVSQYGFDGTQKTTLEKKVIFRDASDGLVSTTFGSAAEVEAYIEQYRDKISPEDYAQLESEAASVIKINRFNTENIKNEKIKSEAEKNKIYTVEAIDYDSLRNGNDIKVKLNGTTYTVESGGKAKSDDVAKYAAAASVPDGSLFVYGENKDVYIYKGDKAYKVKSKNGYSDKWNAHYNDVRQYLLGQGYGTNYESYKITQKLEDYDPSKPLTSYRMPLEDIPIEDLEKLKEQILSTPPKDMLQEDPGKFKELISKSGLGG